MVVRVHIRPALGEIKLERLTALHVQNLYQQKLDSGVSLRRVLYIHVTLHKALKQAVKWLLIPRNVTDAVERPKPVSREIEPFTEEQIQKLLEAAKGDRLEALYVLAVTTGMRQGEILGLQWKDVDLGEGKLRVNRTIFGGVLSPPKTKKSRRSIKLSKVTLLKLLEHRRKQNASKWVFSTKSGTPISCHNLINGSWKPLLEKASLPSRRFHDLRHTCATLLLIKGVHPKIVQELLGHANIGITLDTYPHYLPNLQGEAVRAMEDIFGDS
jgi:integrase